jgi:hypothetical protein
MTENEIGHAIIASAMKVHSAVGPGLLESAYELCLAHELRHRWKISESTQWPSFPRRRESGESRVCGDMSLFRATARKGLDSRLRGNDGAECGTDALVSGRLPTRLGGFKLGYLLNFNVAHMREGITRMVNGL